VLTGHGAEAVRDAIADAITTLPQQLRRSLTWDQGAEMAQHAQLRIDTGLPVYFCDPQSPWQRGTNENTNGLLRRTTRTEPWPAADYLGLHQIEAPMEAAQQLGGVLRAACSTVADALDKLDDVQRVSPLLIEVHRLENEGERIVRGAIASLFVAGSTRR